VFRIKGIALSVFSDFLSILFIGLRHDLFKRLLLKLSTAIIACCNVVVAHTEEIDFLPSKLDISYHKILEAIYEVAFEIYRILF